MFINKQNAMAICFPIKLFCGHKSFVLLIGRQAFEPLNSSEDGGWP